jgi:hypothetical protein
LPRRLRYKLVIGQPARFQIRTGLPPPAQTAF